MDTEACKDCEQQQCRAHYYCEHCKFKVKVHHVKVCFADERIRRKKLTLIWRKIDRRLNGNIGDGLERSQPSTRCPHCFKEIWEAGAHIQQLFYHGDQLRTTSAMYRRLIKGAGLKPGAPIKPRPIPDGDKGLTVVVTPVPPEVLAAAATNSYWTVRDHYHPQNRWANFSTHSKINESALKEATRARGYIDEH